MTGLHNSRCPPMFTPDSGPFTVEMPGVSCPQPVPARLACWWTDSDGAIIATGEATWNAKAGRWEVDVYPHLYPPADEPAIVEGRTVTRFLALTAHAARDAVRAYFRPLGWLWTAWKKRR